MTRHLPKGTQGLLPLAALAALLAALALPSAVRAFPKPSPNRIAWELDVEHGAPTRIAVQTPGEPPRAYWYMTLKVTNNSGREQDFLPVIELVDDRGNIHRSDKNIPKDVFDAVKRRESSRFMEPLGLASGRILQGPDMAKETVAIWPEPLERMGSFTVFVQGLSGEAIWFKDGKEIVMKQADWTKVKPEDAGQILRKTLAIEYQIPGDEFYQGRDRVVIKRESWVMR